MPSKKKPARDLTTNEALRRLFPRPVIEALKATAQEHDQPRDPLRQPPDPAKPRVPSSRKGA